MLRVGSRRRALVGLALLCALGLTLAGCKYDPGEASRDRIEWDHNAARVGNSVPTLAIDASAHLRAQYTADRIRYESGKRSCVLSHTDSGKMSADYPGRAWGENIGCYQGCASAADDATPAFLGSRSHRQNILSLLFSSFGVGVSCNEKYLFVAVHFLS